MLWQEDPRNWLDTSRPFDLLVAGRESQVQCAELLTGSRRSRGVEIVSVKGNLAGAIIVLLLCAATDSTGQTGPADSEPPAGKTANADLVKQLQKVLLESPEVPITKPRGYVRPVAKPYLPADGSLLVNRRCRIAFRPDTGWYLLTLLPEPGAEVIGKTVPRWVLPSKWLSAVEETLAGKKSAIFRITGETTVYKERAFILLRNLKTERREPAAKTPADKPAEVRKSASDATDADKPEEEPTRGDEIAAQLLRRRPGRPVDVPSGAGAVAEATSVAPKPASRQLSEDRGEMRIDRLVRFEFDTAEKWWLARFDSDNTLQDQPVRLLPCKMLELAAKETGYHARRQMTYRARVSGVLTSYKGWAYLLLRKVVKEREMGAF